MTVALAMVRAVVPSHPMFSGGEATVLAIPISIIAGRQ